MIRAYRITRAKYAANAFDGEGARQFGGRWNSPGTPMVYTSSSLSLATLELLVHLEDLDILRDLYVVIAVEFPESLVRTVEEATLPTGWNSAQIDASTQQVGDRWISSSASAVLRVPSAVTPGEVNYLIHPRHPDIDQVVIGEPIGFAMDSRLIR